MKPVFTPTMKHDGILSPVSASEYLMSGPTAAGRTFESRDYMFHHCLC